MTETDIVSLDTDQEARVEELLRRYQNGDLNTPEDIVEEWRAPQTRKAHHDFDSTTTHGYIDPTEIVGRGTPHFEPAKAAHVLSWFYKGEFDRLKDFPPVVEKRPEGYFVTTDGTHRSIVAKGIPLEELYVEYYTVPASALERK